MKNQYLTFEVHHQQIVRTDHFTVVGGSRHYLHARFTFDEDWMGEEITAVFTGGQGTECTPYRIPVVDCECEIPWEVLTRKFFYVGCEAGDLITTDAAKIPVKIHGTPPMPARPFWALQKQLGDLRFLQTAEKSSLVRAINEVNEKAGSGGGGGSIEAHPEGDAIVITTSMSVHADGDTIVIGG